MACQCHANANAMRTSKPKTACMARRGAHATHELHFADRTFCILLAGAAPGVYSGVLDCFVKTFKADGPLAFYNGAPAGAWHA